MIKIMINNIEERNFSGEDIAKILLEKNERKLNILYEKASTIHKHNHNSISLETCIYYPTIYKIKDNCPTCGYKTPESKKEYNPKYIQSIVNHNLRKIFDYNITAINCYNKGTSNFFELENILKILKNYDIPLNLKLNNLSNYYKINNHHINSLIIDSSLTNHNRYNQRNLAENKKQIDKLYKIINSTSKIKIVCEFMINNCETHIDLKNTIDNIININPDTIEIVGYDPFYDSPYEYNPQYSLMYLRKIIAILRIIFPKTNLKIKYASNKNNDFNNILKIGVNKISGIYTDDTQPQLFNIDKINEFL
ncbi:hypothetical protein [Methanosphaera sp. WGK6]|uniref:hypothetical protein n=1 Tax=Methanosphaera sp. WGK6 TaxID=1561964 RepID=UPI00084C1228|nr:hypothetical protein [Methanosphaera sp. WGK6]OED30214.1 hypothetical protein NL43_03520 [Methanosphaera sp. WGK6]